MDIKVDWNDREVRLWAADLAGGRIEKAEVAALNKVGSQVRTVTGSGIKSVRNLPKRRIMEEIYTTRATRSSPAFVVRSRGRPISLKAYGAKPNRGRGRNQKARGVVVSVTPGKRTVLESAFTSSRLNGHIFERVGAARLPIRRIVGPSIATAMKHPTVEAAQTAKVREAWPRVLRSQLERQMAAAARRS